MLKVKAGDLDKIGLLFERYVCFSLSFNWAGGTQRRFGSKGFLSNAKISPHFYRNRQIPHLDVSFGQKCFDWCRQKKQRMVCDGHERKDNFRTSGRYSTRKKQESESLHAALAKLSVEHREILVMGRFQELSYQEITDILGTSEGNIKVRVHRAMKELKSIYLSDRAIWTKNLMK